MSKTGSDRNRVHVDNWEENALINLKEKLSNSGGPSGLEMPGKPDKNESKEAFLMYVSEV